MIWHNANELPMEGDNLLLKISYEDYEGSSDYVISGYYENGWWYKFDGCAQRISSSEYVTKWAYEDDIDNPWHTGTPTEEGWYLIQDSDGAGTFFETEYFDTERIAKWSDDNKFDGLAWQKIEPLGFPVLDMEGEIG